MWNQLETSWHRLVLAALIIVFIWIPRVRDLDHFVTVDERKWLARSANFYQALTQGNYANTFQREHPGVTIMWAGTAAFIRVYPAYAQDAAGQLDWHTDDFEAFLASVEREPMRLLASGRLGVVILTTLVLLIVLLAGYQLFGFWPAVVGALLLTFDPFHLGLSRLLHPDALLATLMLASLMTFLTYLYRGRRKILLVGSAVIAGLAWLTKSPALFLVPLVGTLAWLDGLYRSRHDDDSSTWYIWDSACLLVAWSFIGAAVFVALWPATWQDPLMVFLRVIRPAMTYAVEGHNNPIFVNGRIVDSTPGLSFYLFAFLWRTTPATLLGLLLVPFAWRYEDARIRRPLVALLVFALTFTFFMSAGAKKLDRYLLPAHVALDVVAGVGWWTATIWIREHAPPTIDQIAVVGAVGIALGIQSLPSLSAAPYYLTYYNPLLRGSESVSQYMMVGWGEGLDEAARYLNEKRDAEYLRVASWYSNGPFSYVFDGETLGIFSDSYVGEDTRIPQWVAADYAVLYVNQWQRRLPSKEMLAYFSDQQPEHIVRLNGIEYARVYALRGAPAPAYLGIDDLHHINWDNSIRFIGSTLIKEDIRQGTNIAATLYFQNIGSIRRNLNFMVRLLASDGHEVQRRDGWPLGQPTTSWRRDDIWILEYNFPMTGNAKDGYYRLDVSIYDPKSLVHLGATDAWTSTELGETVAVNYTPINVSVTPQSALSPPISLGNSIQLYGADLRVAEGAATDSASVRAEPGQLLHLRLYWKALASMTTDYTTFVHLVGPDGDIIAQQDGLPLDGFLPTSLWQFGDSIADDYHLQIPITASAGRYQLLVGMYDAGTGERLGVASDPANTIGLGSIIIR